MHKRFDVRSLVSSAAVQLSPAPFSNLSNYRPGAFLIRSLLRLSIMIFYKVVLTFLVIVALSVNVLAAPTSLRARAGGKDNGRKPETVKSLAHRLGQVYQALTRQQNQQQVRPPSPQGQESGFIASHQEWEQAARDAAREHQQQSQLPSPQGQPPYNPPKPHNPRRLPGM